MTDQTMMEVEERLRILINRCVVRPDVQYAVTVHSDQTGYGSLLVARVLDRFSGAPVCGAHVSAEETVLDEGAKFHPTSEVAASILFGKMHTAIRKYDLVRQAL